MYKKKSACLQALFFLCILRIECLFRYILFMGTFMTPLPAFLCHVKFHLSYALRFLFICRAQRLYNKQLIIIRFLHTDLSPQISMLRAPGQTIACFGLSGKPKDPLSRLSAA
jgi:hypothetical protein